MKRLMSTAVAVVAFGLFAFADETMEEWFAEDAETVTEALEDEGETDDGVWSNLTDQVEIDANRVMLDAEDATPVAYRPDEMLTANAASITLTDIAFGAARGVLPELPDDAQAAVAITTNAEGECVFAVANNGAWEVTDKTADSAAKYAVEVDFTYDGISDGVVAYSVSNETGWVSLKSDAVNPVSAKKISTVEFAGSGSFATFAGTYPLPPKGTEGNPWQIGADELQDDVAAWTNANGRLEISGSGKMQNFSPSAPWAGDTVAEAIVGAGVDSIGANAFAGCKGLKTLVMMEEDDPPELPVGTILEGVQIFVPAGAEWAYRTAWSTLESRIFPVYSGGEYLVSNRLYQVEYGWWDAQGANDIAEGLAQFLKQAPAVSVDDYFFPYQVLDWYEDVGVFDELTNRIRRLSALCTSCRTGNFIGRNFDWAYDDVEECVMRVPAADGRFASIGIASRFFPEPWQSIFGVEEFLPELTMDGINEKGVAINVNVVPAGDNGATTGTNPGGERLCAGFAVRHVLDAATNAAHAVEILESKDIYSIPFLEFHWMVSDSAESYIVECVSNKLVVLRAHDAQPKMANFYVSHSPSLCEYDVLTNSDLTAGFHTPHAMGIERYARVSNGLDRVDSVDAMFTNMTNVWYKLKYLPGNEERYWSDLNGAPVPGGAEGQRFTAFDDTYELCVARSNAFKSLQANYVAVTNYEARNHSRTINSEIDPTLTNQVVHTVHTSLYDLEKRTLRVCVQEDYESQFDYALDPVWAIVSADGTRTREFASLSGALAALQDGETLMPAVAGESDLSVKPETFTANDFRAVPVDCPFVITNNDVTVDFRGRVLRDSVSPSTDDDYLMSIVGAMNVSVKNGFLFGTTWRDGYTYTPGIDHRGFAVSDGARAIVSNCVVFIAATSNSVSVTGGSRLRFVNCWVDGQGDGAKEVFHAAGGSRLRFADTKGFWNPENFWGVNDGVVDTLPAITGEQFALEDSYLCFDNTIVSNTVTHWSAGKVATPVTFSGTGNALVLTNDAFITAITGGVAVAKVELADAGATLDSNADFIENDEIVCGFTGGTVKKSGSDDAFTYSVITSVTITLPTGLEGCNYVVSNLTTGAEIDEPSDVLPGGVSYDLPIGAHVAIYCVPSPGYGVVGTNPYDIPEVTAETTIDTAKLPTVKPLAAGIEYIDENGQLQTNYTYEVVTSATTKFTSGWYAVKEDVEITGHNITVEGAAHLILCDGATLTVMNVPDKRAAIEVNAGNALTVYGQTIGTGGLSVLGGEWAAGIGGANERDGGTVTINGGIVTATSVDMGAGIGGGWEGTATIVTINGGVVMATSVDGAGIGSGAWRNVGTVTINGGVVMATSVDGAGIGSGELGSGGTVTINGGTVTAIGAEGGAGIGAGFEGAGVTVMIAGGKITAHGGEEAEDIGHGQWAENRCTVTISGGLFWKKPENRWTIAEGCKAVLNVNEESKADYPWAVAPLWVGGHEITKEQIGVCSWTWHGSISNVLEQMKADGRYNGMQLALAPWLGIDSESLYFGDQEGPEVWDFIKDKIAEGKLNVMSTMINFPGEDYTTLTSITNTQGYMYGVREHGSASDASVEHWKSNLYYTAEAARLTAELGVKTLTTESGFICIDEDLMFQRVSEVCATCLVYGVDFLIESGPQHSQFMTNLLTRLNAAGFHNVGVNFDPGDTALFGPEDPVESFNAMKPWIRMIHAKDCEQGRSAWNEDCVWGDGYVSKDLDFGEGAFLTTVNELGYTGDILYERLSGSETLTPERAAEIKTAMDRILGELGLADAEPVAPGEPAGPFDSKEAAETAITDEKVVLEPTDEVKAELGEGSILSLEDYKAMFAPVVFQSESDEKWYVKYEINEAGTNALEQSVQAVVTNIDLAAIAAASESVTEMPLTGGLPGFYYTLFTSAAVTDVTMSESRDANNSDVLCDKTGTVTFKNVKKPSDAAGFFTVTASPETPFTEKGFGE